VRVKVVDPVPPDDRITFAVAAPEAPNSASTLTVPEADTTAVPAYPPVDVRVMVEVPLFPGEGDEIVMFVAVTVMLGLVTATVVVPEELAL
jgi:hypothetical protein